MIMEGTFKFVKELYIDNALQDMKELRKNNNDIDNMQKLIDNQKAAVYIVNHKKDKKILNTLKDKILTRNI